MIIESENELIQKLVSGCIEGDRQCQQALYKHFYAFGMGISLRYMSNQEDAAYVLNESFFKVFTNIKQYDPKKPFMAWLRKIMTNTAIDHYRSNLKFSNHMDIAEYDQASEDVTIYNKLAYEDLLKMIQDLTPAYRTVFNLFAIDGYSHEEISELLNISVGTSKSNLFKARKKLQELLQLVHSDVYGSDFLKKEG